MSKYNFSGKTAIITGATSGMGEAATRMLAEAGANVLISGRNISKGEELSAELGESARVLTGDVSLSITNKLLVREATKEFGAIHHVVIAAGKLGVGKLDELDEDEWESTISTNLNAVFYLLKYALPEMKKSGGGSIVIIGSIASRHAFPNHPAYAASKAALEGLVRQAALDYSPEIRINLITPAQVDTPLLRDSVKAFENPETIIQETEEKIPMKRLGTTKDINSAIAFLLSDDSSWITGSNIVVDGGFTLR